MSTLMDIVVWKHTSKGGVDIGICMWSDVVFRVYCPLR